MHVILQAMDLCKAVEVLCRLLATFLNGVEQLQVQLEMLTSNVELKHQHGVY